MEAEKLMLNGNALHPDYLELKNSLTENITGTNGLNDVLYADAHLVLLNDMLFKADSMSMANSLEVRVPFLDYSVVDFVSSLPSEFKIDGNRQKKILTDTFGHLIPVQVLKRNKQGFEVPLQKWFKRELKDFILKETLNQDLIIEQKIFNPAEIKKMLSQLYSSHPGEIHSRIWGLMVFQYWWKKYVNSF
jgi:asparagine synthase (glutamine-hydrolysing)